LRELALEQGAVWGTDAHTSCIFETIPGSIREANPDLHSSYDIYKAVRTAWPLRQEAWNVLFASRLTDLVEGLLGPGAVLYNEQYIVKPSRSGTQASFSWHRDSDWCKEGASDVPYISVWVSLDNVDELNGCLLLRPGSHAACDQFTHLPGPEPTKKDYDSTKLDDGAFIDAGRHDFPLPVRSGSAIILTDTLLHASGPNNSAYARRAWMPQFSPKPIIWTDSGLPVSLAIPLKRPE